MLDGAPGQRRTADIRAPRSPKGETAPAWAVGVDLGGSKVAAGLVSSQGRTLPQRREPTRSAQGVEAVMDQVARMVGQCTQSAADEVSGVLGVGIGVAGTTDRERGVTLLASNLGWENVPIRRLIADRVDLPIFVESDANLAALGELTFGAGKGFDDFVFVTVGTGIGAGIVLEGRLYRGVSGAAGELGHITLEPGGPECGCGNRGCLEALASGAAIARQAVERIRKGTASRIEELVDGDLEDVTASVVAKAARASDPLALELLEKAGEHLGVGLAIYVNLLNPGGIVIGGGVTAAQELLFRPMRAALERHALPRNLQSVQVVSSQLGDDAGLVGAAALVFAEIERRSTQSRAEG